MRASRGMDRIYDPATPAERFWESRPKRVRAPYAKEEQAERDPEYKAKYYLVTDSA